MENYTLLLYRHQNLKQREAHSLYKNKIVIYYILLQQTRYKDKLYRYNQAYQSISPILKIYQE